MATAVENSILNKLGFQMGAREQFGRGSGDHIANSIGDQLPALMDENGLEAIDPEWKLAIHEAVEADRSNSDQEGARHITLKNTYNALARAIRDASERTNGHNGDDPDETMNFQFDSVEAEEEFKTRMLHIAQPTW